MMMSGRVRAGFNESPAKAIAVWLAVLILCLLTAPVAAEAQQPGKIYRIGYLQTSSRHEQLHMVKAFEDGLRDLGYRVGQNVVIEDRFAEARPERAGRARRRSGATERGRHCHRDQHEYGCSHESDHDHPDCHGQ